ncbi:hypothetical protein DM298_08120 [Lactobacillus amylovorus]|uniref:Uncharacterized protein n=1 Tax=Lactobacillus amylovorus TaxID=1604 RepID=A0A413DP60_LACAM|nr:hypothetical protein [Lactobacillus amylovorus]QDD70832.1 hypothetical protein DM298_08120 [Lactobacillus amylovorus]RGW88296.1 hypothetical protein DWV49_01175 [Lactobacillus amylovorus]HBQ09215.1 hypothetical protein [Lactobacillus sp.]
MAFIKLGSRNKKESTAVVYASSAFLLGLYSSAKINL